MLGRRLPQTEETGHTGQATPALQCRARARTSFGLCADETPA